MDITCVSDLHGHYPKLEGGDLLIIAGDLTARDDPAEHRDFVLWLMETQQSDKRYRKIVYIGGNHDNFLDPSSEYNQSEKGQWKHHRPKRRLAEGMEIALNPNYGIEYLCDSGTTYFDDKRTIKIWGSPWTAIFPGINPACCAFTMPFGCDTEQHLAEKWIMIPDDTDILITHSPEYGLRDSVVDLFEEEGYRNCGSISLGERSINLKNLKLHVVGHIHEGYGIDHGMTSYHYVNASHVNERYQPVNKPIRIIL